MTLKRGMRLLGLAATAATAVLVGPSAARAQSKEECAAAFDRAQDAREAASYRVARKLFVSCTSEACPTLIRDDCAEELDALQRNVPTVVLRAVDPSGGELVHVRVLVDGAPLVSVLTGTPVDVDPGQHVFRFEADGHAPSQQTLFVRAGEKNRMVDAYLDVADGAPRASRADAGRPVLLWTTGGVAVASFITAAAFGISSMIAHSDCEDRAGTLDHCSSGDVDRMRVGFLVADVAAGLGLVSTGVFAYFLFRPPASSRHAPSVAIDATPRTEGGGLLRLRGNF